MAMEIPDGAVGDMDTVTGSPWLAALLSNLLSEAVSISKSVEGRELAAPGMLEGLGQSTDEDNKEDAAVLAKQSTDLYCPKTGRLHSSLLDFGFNFCPKCFQDLRVKALRPKSDESSAGGGGGDPASVEDDEEEKRPDKTGPIVSHEVEFRDAGGHMITTQAWPEPFDLQIARKGIASDSENVIKIITVLGTSIPSETYRTRVEIEYLLKAGIINNPSIMVNVISTKATICSKAAIEAIRSLVRYYPSASLQAEHIQLESPYAFIAHCLKDLESLRDSYHELDVAENSSLATVDIATPSTLTCNKETFEHLGILIDFVKDHVFKDNIQDEQDRHTQSLCTFRMLWLLFKPGDTVYVESGGSLGAYVVQSVEVDKSIMTPARLWYKPYTITVWNLDFDGTFVGRKNHTIHISYFEGECKITSLKAFPCRFLGEKDNEENRQRLEGSGKKWYGLLRGAQMYYDGPLTGSSKRTFTGRVYVDTSSYYAQHSGAPKVCEINDVGQGLAKCPCEECRGRKPHPPARFPWGKYDFLDPDVTEGLLDEGSPHGSQHRYMICERFVYGFVLKSKKWEKLDVEFCFPPVPNVRAMESLVLPEERKNMIKALVQKFSRADTGKSSFKPWAADFIENKGEGRIFLLHGGPGVGKTFCIAEYTGRALLSLTCGDIGTDEVEIENQLSKWFRLAEKWGAVMLLDEADVFLEKRITADLKRNSLVSVFLRCMEYYRGILFLTTNRVGHFDDAFVSRIHIVIRYESLKLDDRKKIWTRFFAKLTEERKDFEVTPRARKFMLSDTALRDREWNGREIRNVFQIAVALAEFRFSQKTDKTEHDDPVLDQEDFEQVCNMTQEFKEYLTNVHGNDEEARANQVRARLDERPDVPPAVRRHI